MPPTRYKTNRRPEEHQRAVVKIHEVHDELGARTHGAGHDVRSPINELREAVYDDVGAQSNRRYDERRESVVDDELRATIVGDFCEAGNVRDANCRIG